MEPRAEALRACKRSVCHHDVFVVRLCCTCRPRVLPNQSRQKDFVYGEGPVTPSSWRPQTAFANDDAGQDSEEEEFQGQGRVTMHNTSLHYGSAVTALNLKVRSACSRVGRVHMALNVGTRHSRTFQHCVTSFTEMQQIRIRHLPAALMFRTRAPRRQTKATPDR